ncbi:MAG: hypothetical protein RRA92_06070 [Gemmatimonadota bacterium]|nr:hypothetical protein [Gemmatimonadota bacterium]
MTASAGPSGRAASGEANPGRAAARAALSLFVVLAAMSGAPGLAAQENGDTPANPCLQCHQDVARQAAPWQGRRFSHEPHVARAELACAFCHTGLQAHGGITLTGPAACDDCHHGRTAAGSCSRCHRGATGAPDRVFETDVGPFDHPRHVATGFACSGCHVGRSMSAAALDCTTCHGAHHRTEAVCLACHEPGSVPEHPPAVHAEGCVVCHGDGAAWIDRWSREVCSVCHTKRTDHFAGRPCAVCHIVPQPGS